MLTTEAPGTIGWLEGLGVTFTRENGGYRLARCGGASRKRLLQVGDRTGHAITTSLREAFEAQHEDRYGYSDSEQTLELVTIRVTATLPGADVTLAPDGNDADVERGTREATINGESVELEVLRGVPSPGTELKGPAAIDLPESTLIVPDEWSGEVDDTGTIHLQRSA